MIGNGTSGDFQLMMSFSHCGTVPAGVGIRMTAMPSQTKDMPSVTTMLGSRRTWISAPMAA